MIPKVGIPAPEHVGVEHVARHVAIVELARPSALGARRRLKSLVEALNHSGCTVTVVELLPNLSSSRLYALCRVPSVLRDNATVPETLAWSPRETRARLNQIQPTDVICITSRAFHPDLLGPWRTYIDFVDRLSVSYADRAEIKSGRVTTKLYQYLSRRQRRFEKLRLPEIAGAFAAGRADALELGVPWIKISVEDSVESVGDSHFSLPRVRVRHDLGFVGTLDYPPNVEAVVRLDELWPSIVSARPETSLLIAGARPTPLVQSLVKKNSWTLASDFESLDEILGQIQLAVAPLSHASGIQIKVLDAALRAIPQIVSPAVARGLDTEFPITICDTSSEWTRSIVELLNDPALANALGEDARIHVNSEYCIARISADIAQVLDARVTET